MAHVKALRRMAGNRGLNSIFLVGEVVDVGYSPTEKKMNVRARIKFHTNSSKNAYVYLDIYSQKSSAEVMNVVCQVGNVVYVEGEFRNAYIGTRTVKPYVMVTHIECLLRRKDMTPPSTRLINVLDILDPVGYTFNTNPKGRKRKNEKKED